MTTNYIWKKELVMQPISDNHFWQNNLSKLNNKLQNIEVLSSSC